MNRGNINYLKRDNRATVIAYDTHKELIDKTIFTVLDELCLEYLSTLQGRVDAVKIRFNYKKYIPIYVSSSLILQPLQELKAWDLVYVNANNIREIIRHDEDTTIEFLSGEQLTVNTDYEKVVHYIEKSIKIKNYKID